MVLLLVMVQRHGHKMEISFAASMKELGGLERYLNTECNIDFTCLHQSLTVSALLNLLSLLYI